MSSVHSFNYKSVGQGEGADLYEGFQRHTPEYFEYDTIHDEAYQNALKTSSYGRRIPTPLGGIGTSLISSQGARIDTASQRLLLGTAASGDRLATASLARPTTAIRPVGYTSEAGRMFDPFLRQRTATKKTIVIDSKKGNDISPDEKYKGLENKILYLLEESIIESTQPINRDLNSALNKAKEASSLDRTLLRLRDQNGGSTYHNFDLTFSVLFNLANIYAKHEMYVEALNTYTLMTKNKMFPNVNRLKINMGNIYFHLGIYPKAIKMYRMALDQVPSNQKELRFKISHNIGILFIKMGQYSDAASSFEFIMSERADLKTGLHLILCYYALGDADKMKRAFQLLLEVQIDYDDEHKLTSTITHPAQQYILDNIKSDELWQWDTKRKQLAEKNILMSANLISGVIEENFNEGYTWCVEIIKNSNYPNLANELELNKAIMYLKQHDVAQAIETLKYYEKKEPAIAANAVINLTFIYIQMRDMQNAQRYAEICREMDSYNPAAFINSGTLEMIREDYEMARSYFENALEIDSTSFEALYNLGLVTKKLGEFENSLNYFRKIHTTITNHTLHPHVIYQLGNLYELLGDSSGALEWYMQLLSTVNMDSGIYQKIAEMFEAEGDRQQAYQYQQESFRVYPTNLQVISWLGSHFIDLQVAEKAIIYYEKAVLANPNDPYFLLRIAGCFRRIGNSQKSLHLFQEILKRFPENLDCLRALIHLTQTLNLDELNQKYLLEFQRIEKVKETRQRVGSSRPTTTSMKITSANNSTNNNTNKRNSSRTNSNSKRNSGRSSSTSVKMSGGGSSFDNQFQQVNSTLTTISTQIAGYNNENEMLTYSDPLGPPAERPRTGKVNTSLKEESDEELDADELLPM